MKALPGFENPRADKRSWCHFPSTCWTYTLIHPGDTKSGLSVFSCRSAPEVPFVVCACADSDFIFRKLGFEHVKCKECGVVYTKQALKDDISKRYYERNDVNIQYHQIIESAVDSELDTLRFDYCLEKVFDRIDKNSNCRNVLDIGCGTGLFLERAKRKGLSPVGIEPNEYAADAVRSRGLKAFSGLKELANTEMEFDIITLWTVLEHIIDPQELIQDITLLLNPNGLLAIEVPNINGFATILLRERSTVFAGDQHVTFFSVDTLTRFLEEHGYTNIHAETYISELHTAVNFLNYEDPYLGETPLERFPHITADWIHANMMGHRLFTIFKKIR